MSVSVSITDYKVKSEDKIFLDTNIWLYLFCPIGSYNQSVVESYNRFFLELLKSKCKIYTSSLILSEFFNTYCRIDFQIKRNENPNKYRNYKKDFRNTEYFNELTVDICELIKNKILKYANKIEDNFISIDLDKILISDKNYDFNDKYFAQLCEENGIKILTNDKDFLNLSNEIIIITL